MSKAENQTLEINWLDPNEINVAEYNPRKITPKKKKELRDSMVKYGLREPLKVNMYEGRENVLISGHQRLKIAKELGMDLVPVTFEFLPLEDEKEMNLRLNKNGGEFDMELVMEVVDREILLEIGFMDKELPKVLSEFEQKFEDIDITEPVYPIAPKFNEKYDYVMIMCSTEMDFHWLKNVLEIEREIGHKSTYVGEGKAILVTKFQKLYKAWISK